MKVPPIKHMPTPPESKKFEITDSDCSTDVKVKMELDKLDSITFICVLCDHKMITKTEITTIENVRTEWIHVRCTGIGCEQSFLWRRWRKNNMNLPVSDRPKVAPIRRVAAELKNSGLELPKSVQSLYAYMYLNRKIPVRYLKRLGGILLPEYKRGTLMDSSINYESESISIPEETNHIHGILSEIYPGLDHGNQFKFVRSLLSRYRLLNRIDDPLWDFPST